MGFNKPHPKDYLSQIVNILKQRAKAQLNKQEKFKILTFMNKVSVESRDELKMTGIKLQVLKCFATKQILILLFFCASIQKVWTAYLYFTNLG